MFQNLQVILRRDYVENNGKVHSITDREGQGVEYMYSYTFSLNLELDGNGLSTPPPGSFNPVKQTRNPLYRRLGGPQGRSG